MKCLKKGKLQEFADGALSEIERKIAAAHLQGCQRCQRNLVQIKTDSSFIREKLKSFNPAAIPEIPFVPAHSVGIKESRLPVFRQIFHTSVRIPAAALVLAGMVLIGLIFGLLVQTRRLSRPESASSTGFQQEAIYVSSASSFQAFRLDIDLKNYKPIENPNIILLQEESQ
jgi:anti-sigma factor RsiW